MQLEGALELPSTRWNEEIIDPWLLCWIMSTSFNLVYYVLHAWNDRDHLYDPLQASILPHGSSRSNAQRAQGYSVEWSSCSSDSSPGAAGGSHWRLLLSCPLPRTSRECRDQAGVSEPRYDRHTSPGFVLLREHTWCWIKDASMQLRTCLWITGDSLRSDYQDARSSRAQPGLRFDANTFCSRCPSTPPWAHHYSAIHRSIHIHPPDTSSTSISPQSLLPSAGGHLKISSSGCSSSTGTGTAWLLSSASKTRGNFPKTQFLPHLWKDVRSAVNAENTPSIALRREALPVLDLPEIVHSSG